MEIALLLLLSVLIALLTFWRHANRNRNFVFLGKLLVLEANLFDCLCYETERNSLKEELQGHQARNDFFST